MSLITYMAGYAYACCAPDRTALQRKAVGYSSVQASILVSGLWGMLYFKEIPDQQRGSWFSSAVVATAGIMLLMHERAS